MVFRRGWFGDTLTDLIHQAGVQQQIALLKYDSLTLD